MGGYREKAFKSDEDAIASIRRAVRDSAGSVTAAARALGVSFRTLSRYITRLGLRDELRTMRSGGGDGSSQQAPAPTAKRVRPRTDYSALTAALESTKLGR